MTISSHPSTIPPLSPPNLSSPQPLSLSLPLAQLELGQLDSAWREQLEDERWEHREAAAAMRAEASITLALNLNLNLSLSLNLTGRNPDGGR